MDVTAAEFILLMLFVIGLLTCGYYAAICLPIVLEKSPVFREVDPERNYLIPNDLNDNKTEQVPTAPVCVPNDEGLQKVQKSDAVYPTIINEKKPPLCVEGAVGGPEDEKLTLVRQYEEDDVPQNIRKLEDRQQFRSEGNRGSPERASLLQGDDEDGLLVCEPSVRSKNTGEPLPSASPSKVVLPIAVIAAGAASAPPAEEINKQEESQPQRLEKQRDTPDEVQLDTIDSAPEAIAVPPECNITSYHPPTHMVVTMPQPLNAPPLMVAPVYDEPCAEQDVMSLQQQLQTPYPVVVSMQEPKTSDDYVPRQSDSPYGWAEDVANQLPETSAAAEPGAVERLVVTRKIVVDEATGEKRPQILRVESEFIENPSIPSDNSAQNSPVSNGGEITDTSEPEITEYNFETGRLVPSTNQVLADEISSVPNVQVLRYVSLDESSILEADASASDSIRVQIGDQCAESDTVDTESNDDQIDEATESAADSQPSSKIPRINSPDLTLHRRSPDGDSLKSNEEELHVNGSSSDIKSPDQEVKDINAKVTIVDQKKKISIQCDDEVL